MDTGFVPSPAKLPTAMSLPSRLSIATVAALLASAASAATAQTTLPETMVRRIDSVFVMYNAPDSPGCATSVVRDGQSVFAKGYGMSDLQHNVPITPASIFHVASISKQFAAFSIVLLANEGKLGLDDDIRKHLPEMPDFGMPITIRQLIHHTSGLRDQWSLLSLGGWRADDPKSEADILWLTSRQRALNFAPGSEHLYSNTGYTLLGTIVQRVSGKTLRQFTTERIFVPLGMTNTHFHDDHSMIVPGRTSAYAPRGGRGGAAGGDRYAISIPVFDNAGATSLFTTVQDMAKWDANFLQPKVGDARVMATMHERGKLTDGSTIPYASALVHGEIRGLPTVGHGGADAGYRADYMRFPGERHAFITMCNVATANPQQLNAQVANIVLGDKMSAPVARATPAPAPQDVPIAVAELRRIAGIYVDRKTGATAEVVFNDSTQSLHAGRTAGARKLVHVGNNEFVLPGDVPQRYRIANGTMAALANNNMHGDRVEAANRSPAALREIAGRYRSEELDMDWTIAVVGDSALSLSRRRVPAQRMNPVYRDGFSADVGNMRFTRDGAGKVTGFLLTAGRVRNVRFDRIGS